ncbi:unnamed protein product [Gadus morhua 'NCC']
MSTPPPWGAGLTPNVHMQMSMWSVPSPDQDLYACSGSVQHYETQNGNRLMPVAVVGVMVAGFVKMLCMLFCVVSGSHFNHTSC